MSGLSKSTRARSRCFGDLFAARGRALASLANGVEKSARAELARVREALISAGFRPYLPAVETALAA